MELEKITSFKLELSQKELQRLENVLIRVVRDYDNAGQELPRTENELINQLRERIAMFNR